jgi:DNA-binding response OmpR family regulator
VSEAKPIILVVEDDLDVAEMLTAFFRAENYEVHTVNWGEDAIRSANTTLPNLVILDIRLPDIDGFEVARRMRTSRRTREIPILFLTEKRERRDRLHGLELGADDYITKPFDIQELRLRVKNTLVRCSSSGLANPVTQLPDGTSVVEKLLSCLKSDGWAILTVRLENLDRFREQYGFVASDDVLRAVGLMIQNAVSEIGTGGDFIGHLSVTQFLVVTVPGVLPDLSNRLRARLDQSLEYFYPLGDQSLAGEPKGRLSIHLGKLFASQGPFRNLDDLRSQLLHT